MAYRAIQLSASPLTSSSTTSTHIHIVVYKPWFLLQHLIRIYSSFSFLFSFLLPWIFSLFSLRYGVIIISFHLWFLLVMRPCWFFPLFWLHGPVRMCVCGCMCMCMYVCVVCNIHHLLLRKCLLKKVTRCRRTITRGSVDL